MKKKVLKIFSFLFLISLFMFLIGCTKESVINFNSDGGTDVSAITQDVGSEVEEPTEPTKVGHTFKGWYFDEAKTDKYTFDKMPKEDLTLYAKWEINKYNVKFLNDTVEVAKVTVEYGKDATAPSNPVKEGYTFKEWDKAYTNVTKDLEVNAVFVLKTFEVKFMVDGVQAGEAQTVDYDSAATAPVSPTKEGYTFKRWDKEYDNVKENLVINAEFERITFTVKFLNKDGTELKSEIVNYGEDAIAPANPSLLGYEFLAWDKDFSNVKANVNVKATYNIINYDIEFYDGETKLDLVPKTYTVEDKVNFAIVDKADKVFAGWFLTNDFTGDPITGIDKGKTGKVVVYAKYLETLHIFYELNEGSWGWTVGEVVAPGGGIDPYTNLPEIFMQDFYTWLYDNDLLTSSIVDSGLHKTTWEDFSMNYDDPRAIYNWAANKPYGGLSADLTGYSQFFSDSGTGTSTGKINTLVGGFFGADGYKEKYATIAQHLAYLLNDKYTGDNLLWDGGADESLAGFVFDGYFYGTQGLMNTGTSRDARFNALRGAIPTPEKGYEFVNNALKEYVYDFLKDTMGEGQEAILSIPSREGYFFDGWYESADFSGERIYKIEAGETPAAMYYAKWKVVSKR